MGETQRRLWKVWPRTVMGWKSLGISLGRFLLGGRSLFGVSPVNTVPAGGSCRGLYQGRFGVPTFTGALVIASRVRTLSETCTVCGWWIGLWLVVELGFRCQWEGTALRAGFYMP